MPAKCKRILWEWLSDDEMRRLCMLINCGLHKNILKATLLKRRLLYYENSSNKLRLKKSVIDLYENQYGEWREKERILIEKEILMKMADSLKERRELLDEMIEKYVSWDDFFSLFQ